MSQQNAHPNRNDFQLHHLKIMNDDGGDQSNTIFQLKASLKEKLGPQSPQKSSSPEAAGEMKRLLQRLVEIDVESRELLKRVFSLLEKDEKLEQYIKERIEDPRVSQLWQLIEQVLVCQDDQQHTNFDEMVMKAGNSNPIATDKAIIKGNEIDEVKPERFKVRNLMENVGDQVTQTTSGTTSTTTTAVSDDKSKGK